MEKVLQFLKTFYATHYSHRKGGTFALSRVGSFKILGLGFSFCIFLALGIGIEGDLSGLVVNIIASHILTTVAMAIVNRVKPGVFDNRSDMTLLKAMVIPLYLISWLFAGLAKDDVNSKGNINKFGNIVSAIKNYFVKDNVGLHFSVAYITFDVLWKINIWLAIVLCLLGIFITEVIDKYIFKGKFSWKDIVAGILGILFCYLINR